jgi:hypothetical protein
MPKLTSDPSSAGQNTGLGCLLRLGWLVFGHGLMGFCLFILFGATPEWAWSKHDSVYWFAVALCLVVRYIDITRYDGRTGSGEPATLTDWRRYALILVAVALVLWGAARGTAFLGRG